MNSKKNRERIINNKFVLLFVCSFYLFLFLTPMIVREIPSLLYEYLRICKKSVFVQRKVSGVEVSSLDLNK